MKNNEYEVPELKDEILEELMDDNELWDLEEFGTVENAKRAYNLFQKRLKQPSRSLNDIIKELD